MHFGEVANLVVRAVAVDMKDAIAFGQIPALQFPVAPNGYFFPFFG